MTLDAIVRNTGSVRFIDLPLSPGTTRPRAATGANDPAIRRWESEIASRTLRVGVYRIRDVSIGGRRSWIYRDGIPVHDDAIGMGESQGRSQQRTADVQPTDEIEIESPVFALGGLPQGVYGHWIVDHLPQIVLAQRLGLLENARLLLSSAANNRPWIAELLETIGLSPQHVLRTEPARRYRPSEVRVLGRTRIGGRVYGHHHRETWDLMRTWVSTQRPPVGESAGRRLFLSRARWNTQHHVPRRNLSNEVDVWKTLRRLGFERFIPEAHSVTEQLALFAEASIVVAEDGSALHGAVASAPGTRVVLIMHRANTVHFAQAALLGHELVLVRPSVEPDGTVAVDPRAVRRAITTLLAD